ncbi:MAG: DegT/DnrJ/EryC1/StrS family aminotransferase [Flavobacteriales bacterium]|nr:DegT/DnrJ/EryC1/StrS family aminotransferase [Flavobacteriales bacterium]
MPFIDLQSQYRAYKSEIDSAIQNVLDTSQYIMGPPVKQFEANLSQYVGAKHAIGCASGTDALLLALMAIGIKPNDEIITTPFTFIASSEVISLLGAVPVFVDIEADTYNINAELIEDKITSKTKAIIPVSLYGQIADMDAINSIAERHNLIVIEDAAQSFGATYKGKKSCNLSHFGCTSFFPSKPLGCYGDGGALFTNDDELAEKARLFLAHGSKRRYDHEVIGINGRLDAIQAAILDVKLKYFDDEVQSRAEIGQYYIDLLRDKGIQLPTIKEERTSVFAQFTLQSENRQALIKKLNENDVPTAIHYPTPLHLQKCYKSLNYSVGDFPVSEKAANEVFSLPMSPFITKEQQELIVKYL